MILIHEIHVWILPLHSISIIYELIIDSHKDQLPFGLIAQLTEHCIGIAEVRVRVLTGLKFSGLSRCCLNSAKLQGSYAFVRKFSASKYVINVTFSSPSGFHIRILHGDGIEARRIRSSWLCQDSLEYIWWIHCSNKYCRSNSCTRKDWRRRRSQCSKDISIGKLYVED